MFKVGIVNIAFFLSFGLSGFASAQIPNATILTPKDAHWAFTVVAQDGVPRRILEAGCETRSFLDAQALLDVGVVPLQIHASGDSVGIRSPRLLNSKLKNWKDHVAVLIFVRIDKNTVREEVIDPSLFTDVVPRHVWLQAINLTPEAKITVQYYSAFVFPDTYQFDQDLETVVNENLALLKKYEQELHSGKNRTLIAREIDQDFVDHRLTHKL